jgi:WD40 repeat protein
LLQVCFSPDGNYLYSGARRDDSIHCWDIRATGQVCTVHCVCAHVYCLLSIDDLSVGLLSLVQATPLLQDAHCGVSLHAVLCARCPCVLCQVVCSMQRPTSSTNQRIGFSIEPCGRHLATGGCDGCVRVSGADPRQRTHACLQDRIC